MMEENEQNNIVETYREEVRKKEQGIKKRGEVTLSMSLLMALSFSLV